MYRVIKSFMDLKDENHVYCVGDTYPRKGTKPTLYRYKELSTKLNKQGVPLIKKVEEDD